VNQTAADWHDERAERPKHQEDQTKCEKHGVAPLKGLWIGSGFPRERLPLCYALWLEVRYRPNARHRHSSKG
jgi:hypothetical protein